MDDLEFKRYISNIANLGDAKQTGLYVFDILDKFKLSSNNKFLIEDITDLYVNFISSLEQLEDNQYEILENYVSMQLLGIDTIEIRKEKIKEVTKEDLIKIAKKIKIDTIYLLKGETKHEKN